MAQTINMAPAAEQTRALGEIIATVINKAHDIVSDTSALLDSRSDFYSRLMEEDITWRQALRAGVILPLLFILGIGCVVEHPLTAIACMAGAAWVTHRLNKTDAEMERKAKKGGKR